MIWGLAAVPMLQAGWQQGREDGWGLSSGSCQGLDLPSSLGTGRLVEAWSLGAGSYAGSRGCPLWGSPIPQTIADRIMLGLRCHGGNKPLKGHAWGWVASTSMADLGPKPDAFPEGQSTGQGLLLPEGRRGCPESLPLA